MRKHGTGLPQETIDAIAKYKLAVKWPMGTPIGKWARSFNVALRKELDLYACIRPLKYYQGVPTMHIAPWGINAVLFRENVEDVYSGTEFVAGDKDTIDLIKYINEKFGRDIPELSGIGIKHVSKFNSERIVRAAAMYARKYDYDRLTLMHKGNIMKFTEGAFRNRWYDLIKKEFPEFITERQEWILKNNEKKFWLEQIARLIEWPSYDFRSMDEKLKINDEIFDAIEIWDKSARKEKKVVNDLIADNTLQQVFLNPQQFGVIAATNLNGDYLSDAFAAVVWGLGISPWANVNFETDTMLLEATHGTADTLAYDAADPLSHMLSGNMWFELKWHDKVAKTVEQAVAKQIITWRVTGDFTKTANDIQTVIKTQIGKIEKGLAPETPWIEHLLQYAEVQSESLTRIGTMQFAHEICELIAKS